MTDAELARWRISREELTRFMAQAKENVKRMRYIPGQPVIACVERNRNGKWFLRMVRKQFR